MLSWRLWHTISEPAYKNPIFNRIRNERRLLSKPAEKVKVPRYVTLFILFMLVMTAVRIPHFLVLLFQIPAIFIVLIILIPILLPVVVIMIGGYLVSKITTHIYKEKQQYTYDLLCTSPDGALRANWLFASGIIHRGTWFHWIQLIAKITGRVGILILAILAGLTLISLHSNNEIPYYEPIHTLVNLSLVLALYYSSMIQSFVLTLVVGLYATSLNLNRRDTNLVGITTYIILHIIPYLVALSLFILSRLTVSNPHPAVSIGLDAITLGSIYIIQELNITLVWIQLTKRLNSISHYTALSGQIASVRN